MKKLFLFFLVIAFSFALIACQSDKGTSSPQPDESTTTPKKDEETATPQADESITILQMKDEGVTFTITLKAVGDDVFEQSSDNEVMYDVVGVSTPEEAEEFFGELFVGYDTAEGVTHRVEYLDDRVIETLTVNYANANIDELRQLTGATFDENAANGISLEKTIEMLREEGYELVE